MSNRVRGMGSSSGAPAAKPPLGCTEMLCTHPRLNRRFMPWKDEQSQSSSGPKPSTQKSARMVDPQSTFVANFLTEPVDGLARKATWRDNLGAEPGRPMPGRLSEHMHLCAARIGSQQ